MLYKRKTKVEYTFMLRNFNNVVSLLNEILRWISYGMSDLVDNFISLKIVKSFKDQR